ncbi:MAG: GNAT family N-acetyltransferase [Maritimibacter sp.]
MEIAPHLQTRRLKLAPLTWGDALFFWKLAGNVKVRRFLGGPVPRRRRLAQFRHSLDGVPSTGIWVVRPQMQKAAIGLLELSPHKDGRDFEVSYQFKPSAWGQGFASEATARVVGHAINDLGLERVIAETQSANAGSCRLLSGLGFVEGTRLERFGTEQVIFVKS